uniref:PIPK domain-containing protein n=1 Tax=Octactis speculum TaxID=3111310 RepID=A0A7S2GHP5_9STRA|mmetsp:Transcript_48689/g.66335  ORF Transcript_48689/g.66335 Transcript_48689/m.66335 type:complete len:219 (+) Transcript_48689:318-974(+)
MDYSYGGETDNSNPAEDRDRINRLGRPNDHHNHTTNDFLDYAPHTFLAIREKFNLDTKTYCKEWEGGAKMKLNEGGASNAFFFYSGSERFIAKSCTKAEMDVLLDMASDYKTYLVDNPESFLTRILGAHRLRMYGTMFYFFVMENVLKRPDTSNAGDTPEWNTDNDNQTLLKYDIKGSSYNRNSTIPKNGQSVTCKYCNRKYSYQNPANRLRSCPDPF